jgi:hypothetical protein
MDEEVITSTDKDSDKEEPMEVGGKQNPNDSPDTRGRSDKKITEQKQGTPEETVTVTVPSCADNKGEEPVTATPAVNINTPERTNSKTWADETTDQELAKWILSSGRRRRRQEKRPRERASSLSLERNRESQSPSPRFKKK